MNFQYQWGKGNITAYLIFEGQTMVTLALVSF